MSNTETYNIYRNNEKIASNLTTKTYTDTELTPNTEYSYQISASNKTEESNLSNTVVITTDYSPVENITVNKGSLELEIGDFEQLLATVSPSTAEQGVEWTSSDDTVATVGINGNVEAISEGEVFIIASSVTDSTIDDQCIVTVIEPATP